MMINFDPQRTSDFLKHPLFIKWVRNPNEELDRYWHKWVENHPEKKEMLLKARDLAKALTWKKAHKMEAGDFHRIKDELLLYNAKRQSGQIKSISSGRMASFWRWSLPLAASLLVLGFVWFAYLDQGNAEKETPAKAAWIIKSVPKGMKKVYQLPDGSKVTLNADSEIQYLEDFGSERLVKLKGQAFFEVVKNPKLPFSVQSGALKTTVLGTSFDISAYPEDAQFHVAVVTGKVNVATENGVSASITPNEATYYDTKKQALTKSGYDYDHLIGWKSLILKFKEEPYPQVFERLSRWYNVEFQLADEGMFAGKYSGEFTNESLENVLHGMQYSLGFTYEIQNGIVKIKSK